MLFSSRIFDYSSDRLIPCLVMDGPPTEKTEGTIGVLYMDKESGSLYKCVSGNYRENVFTWKIVGEVSDDVIRQCVADYLAGNPVSGGLSAEERRMLLTLFRGAVYQSETAEETAAAYSFLQNLWGAESEPDSNPDAALTSISVTYSGGDVAVGTAVTELTGIVVTAHYSDGTSETVTGYTLSGTIVEGPSTVTVSYGGKTTTFAVTGVSEESEPVEVTMTEALYSWPKSTEYSDGGATVFPGVMGVVDSSMWYSDAFEHDTVVTVAVLYGANNVNLRQYCGCVSPEQEIKTAAGSALTVHYLEQIGTASASEYSVQYTVRAGYRLAVINYNSGSWQSLNVTK